MRLVHFSDLHFYKPIYSPFQLFSKRVLGNLCAAMQRRNFAPEAAYELLDYLEPLNIDRIIITGDFTTTARAEEFQLAKKLVDEIESRGWKVHILPGNHDVYTKKSVREKSFYKAFPTIDFKGDTPFSWNLQDDRIALYQLKPNWWLILLDTTITTRAFSAKGEFNKVLEDKLVKLLEFIPKEDKILVANHYPITSAEPILRQLERRLHLANILIKHPNVLAYLHGHTHKPLLCPVSRPIMLDSGSISHHKVAAFNLLELKEEHCTAKLYKKRKNTWYIEEHDV